MSPSDSLTLGEAVTRFISSTNNTGKAGSKGISVPEQQEVQRFVREAGRDQMVADITPYKIEDYSGKRSADSIKTLAPVKAFLGYLHSEGHSAFKLATHLKVKRSAKRSTASVSAALRSSAGPKMTKEGHAKALAELDDLRAQRVVIADDVKKAMADKDYRENAPLDAARDKQGHVEARIRELEHTLNNAEILGENGRAANGSGKAEIGSRLAVTDMTYDEELVYVLVDPSEVDPRQGRISVESPAGKAFLGKGAGQVVIVKAPAGNLRYRIEKIDPS